MTTSTWDKLRALGPGETLLLAEAGTALVLAWVGLRVLPFRILRRVYAGGRQSAAKGALPPERITWATQAMARHLPGKMTCLPQAIAAQVMLRRRGYASELRIGVASRGDDGKIRAHAWVEWNGQAIIGGLEDLDRYSLLSSPTFP